MLASGFTAAPVSRFLLYGIITTSILASITDTKHLFYIQPHPHIWKYGQLWRVAVWQLCYTNSTELLFAAMTLYNMRVIERLWGSRKFASFLLSTYFPTTLLTPLLLTLVFHPLTSFGHASSSSSLFNLLPAGPTPLIFGLLAQYHAAIPTIYKYRVVTSASSSSPPGGASSSSASHQDPYALVFSDKSTTYLLAGQLALSSLPGSALAAGVGWVVGMAWRGEWGPGLWGKWRVPGWVVGEARGARGRGQELEGLRRRMEGEGAAARGTGTDTAEQGPGQGGEQRRRGIVGGVADQFRGSF